MSLPQLTRTRVENALKSNDWNYHIDDDGDVACGFYNIAFFLTIDEALLRVSGWWRGELKSDEHLSKAMEWANQKNADVLMPKTVLAGDPRCIIFENSVFTPEGISDEQLNTFILDSFGLSDVLSNELAEIFPDIAPKEEEN